MGTTLEKDIDKTMNKANDDTAINNQDIPFRNQITDINRSSERKKTVGGDYDKETSKQYFNNIANNHQTDSSNTPPTNQDQEKEAHHHDPFMPKTIPKIKASKSSCNLAGQELEEVSPETNSMIEAQFSQPTFDTSNPFSPSSFKEVDIDIDMKTVFRTQRHGTHCYKNNGNVKFNIDDSSSIQGNTNEYELNYYRDGTEIRKSYIAKLICKKVMSSQKEKTHNSLIIFDWDDTLLCTSFLTPNGVFNEDMKLSDKESEKIAKLEVCVHKLLSISIEKGDVYIITNAGPGWVEFSAEKFYPSIMPLLNKIKIISARGEYEAKFPGDSRMWKIQAFLNTQKSFDSDLVTNIICLGDSFIEMEAGQTMANKFTQAFFKTVKFKESPKPEELQKQLTLVADQFSTIYSSIKNLTIRVERKKK